MLLGNGFLVLSQERIQGHGIKQGSGEFIRRKEIVHSQNDVRVDRPIRRATAPENKGLRILFE